MRLKYRGGPLGNPKQVPECSDHSRRQRAAHSFGSNAVPKGALPLGRVICGESVEALSALPAECVDLVFADPPYNLQLGGTLRRPDDSTVSGVDAQWDRFSSFAEYDAFTEAWLTGVRRLMRPRATLFVIGSYHNIFRIGTKLQDLGFWLLGDVIWRKVNPMPNFRGRRFTNAHETLIWAARDPDAKQYTFNYDTLKSGNDDVQVRSDWSFPLCTGRERMRDRTGAKLHPTQKPEALIRRLITASSNPGDVVFDPFFGTGTTGAVAKAMGRQWCGIERDPEYCAAAQARIDAVTALDSRLTKPVPGKRSAPRVAFQQVVEGGLLEPGSTLVDARQRFRAVVRPDGAIVGHTSNGDEHVGSIHRVGANLQGRESCNGWSFWYVKDGEALTPVEDLRERIRREWRLKD